MTNKLFDSFVNDKLKDYESLVPEGLWEKIIAEEEKPKVIFWWQKNMLLIGIAFLLFVSGIGYFAFNKKSISSPVIADNLQSNKAKVVRNVENYNSVILNDESKKTNNNSAITQQLNSTKNVGINEAAFNNSAKENNAEKTINATLNNNTDVALNSNLVNDFKVKKANASAVNKLFAFKQNTSKKETFLARQKTSLNNFKVGANVNESILGTDFYETHQPNENGFIVMQESNLETANSLKEKQVLSLGKLFSGSDDCPTTRGKYRNDTYVEGYASPDFAFKNVISTKAGNDMYLQKKDSSESMSLGFTIGARFSKSITNNMLLKAGVQYSQMSEKFTLRTENDRKQTIVINSHTIVRPGQSDTTISDTSVFVQIGYRVRTNMNYYRNLEVPVIISYEFSQRNESKWKLALNLGAIVNITSWYEGKTIDAGYNLVSIGNKSNNGFYKHQFGVSLYGGVSVIRNITPDLDVFAEPYFRYGLYNVQGSAGFNQKFNLAGLQLGARLKISKNKHL